MSYDRSPQPQSVSINFVSRLLTMISGSVMLVALLVAVGIWRSGGRFFEGLRMMVQPPPPTQEVDIRSVVVRQIQSASELTTAVFTMEAVVPAKSDRTLGGYVVGRTNLLYIAHGEVRAGVDLSELTSADVQVMADGVRITLPPPRILDSKIDVDRSSVYDYDRGFLGLGPDNAPVLQDFAQEEALSKIMDSACAEGILQEANARAEQLVGQLLATAGYANYRVLTQPPTVEACPVN
ncbi:MAG: DUF4230 domain-containing protein [Leptolyngbyaceae cyanobacterium SM1_1_3]|nr:DUF4230 domain-containing protein [Leptolyngbyaceae cyanobacterium SM1_1_3]NJN02274.1 DUF4230 domain-containing protein [Leptolyngbyaceae cyanobacterium RM1_1_2]NJO08446.1 DUF4230 domain-containing protein [Leptolyngbyaceae cyanobacterium SL_1_1]